jgi:diketogulonate reductase-like aldo/keto reductase
VGTRGRHEPSKAGVGQAINAAGLQREDVFVTTKLFDTEHRRDDARRALHSSLSELEMTHVDLYLIHWPVPSQDLYVEAWQTLIELQREGLTRAIGVSNFQPAHLERIIAETGVIPAVNQIELHPRLQQPGLRREHAERGIVTEAWSRRPIRGTVPLRPGAARARIAGRPPGARPASRRPGSRPGGPPRCLSVLSAGPR